MRRNAVNGFGTDVLELRLRRTVDEGARVDAEDVRPADVLVGVLDPSLLPGRAVAEVEAPVDNLVGDLEWL